MKDDSTLKPKAKSQNITNFASEEAEDIVPDFPPPGEGEPDVAAKIEHSTPEGINDPREDVMTPEMKNEDEAIAESSSDYVPPDQPLGEIPRRQSRRKRMDKRAEWRRNRRQQTQQSE